MILTIIASEHTTSLNTQTLNTWLEPLGTVSYTWLHEGVAADVSDINDIDHAHKLMAELAPKHQLDYCIQPTTNRRKQLLISDMDSTMIGQECIDELADMAGIGAQVSDITERAMQGKLDFSASLTQRVALLKNLPVDALEKVWQERIKLNQGAETLVKTMKAHGAFTMLVSGGFTFFTDKVAEQTGFDAHHANELHTMDDVLTGLVIPPILHSTSKKDYLEAALTTRNITPELSIAVGDGANDADMIEAAALGVAYYAKPLLQQKAQASVNYTDLTSLLYFQGYKQDEILYS